MKARIMNALLDGLLHVLLSSIELLLQELNFALETLVCSLRLLTLLLMELSLGELAFCLLEIGVENRELVLERGDLLVLLEEELLVLLVLRFSILSTLHSVVGFKTKGREFLSTRV